VADTEACVDHAHFDYAHRHRPAGQPDSIIGQPVTDTACVTDNLMVLMIVMIVIIAHSSLFVLSSASEILCIFPHIITTSSTFKQRQRQRKDGNGKIGHN